jgi:deazaflavin-dependent oxidoreductase (nitroreductase family)
MTRSPLIAAPCLSQPLGSPSPRQRGWGRLGAVVLLALVAAAASATAPLTAAQLAAVADQSTVELTTTGRKSGQQRPVTIWFVVDDQGRLFVQSGGGGTTDWYRNLLETPAVTLRIGDLRASAISTPIGDAAETARVHELFRQKYLRARIFDWFGGETGRGKVVRLDALTSG